jgi:hypothetical protein
VAADDHAGPVERAPRAARQVDGRKPVRRADADRQMRRRMMRSPSELAGFWNRLADLDAEISQCHADGYAADVDRLLDERGRWQQERDALFRGLAPVPRRS